MLDQLKFNALSINNDLPDVINCKTFSTKAINIIKLQNSLNVNIAYLNFHLPALF